VQGVGKYPAIKAASSSAIVFHLDLLDKFIHSGFFFEQQVQRVGAFPKIRS
jgi:hypothetical protein